MKTPFVNRRLVAVEIILVVLAWIASPVLAQTRSEDFGRHWVRSHPFTLMAVTLRADAAIERMYVDAGLNTLGIWKNRPPLFDWAQSQLIPWHLHIDKRKTHDEMKVEIAAAMKTYPGGQGLLIFDEPRHSDLPRIGEIVAWAKQAYPELLIYTNGYPAPRDNESMAKLWSDRSLHPGIYDEPPVPYSYEDYLTEIATIVRPDVLMIDIYPFNEPPENDPAWIYHNRYFLVLATLREVGLREKMPYWTFVQAFGKKGYTRVPSESDLRMQVYSSLAFGVSGIGYFTYDNTFDTAMLATDYAPTPIYHNAAKINKEIAHLGKSLRFLTSTDVRYVLGKPLAENDYGLNSVPRGLGIYHPQSRVASEVKNIQFGAEADDRKGLIGYFSDDDGGSYFMLVNLTHGEGQSADQTAVPVTITLAESVESVCKLSRVTGKSERVTLSNHQIQFQLPGGTGELFKIGDADFAVQ